MYTNVRYRLKTPTSRVVTSFDVNVLVSSCFIGMLSSVYGLRNTQEMNASLNKVQTIIFAHSLSSQCVVTRLRHKSLVLLHLIPLKDVFPSHFIPHFVSIHRFCCVCRIIRIFLYRKIIIKNSFFPFIRRLIKSSQDYVRAFRCIQ